MELIAFRVTMYKGIIDSGWVDVNRLTVLVGKNESGKTSLLRALHKLNPYTPDSNENDPNPNEDNPDSYKISREWPRAHRKERRGEQVVCQAKFKLSDGEKLNLTKITGRKKIPDAVEVSRNYEGQLEINGAEDLLLDKPPSKIIDDIFSILPNLPDEFSGQFKEIAYKCFTEVRHLADEIQLTALGELAQAHQ